MPLVASMLEMQLNLLSKEDLSPEEANAKFAEIITDYIKTAQVTGSGTGSGNMGAPIATTISGSLQ